MARYKKAYRRYYRRARRRRYYRRRRLSRNAYRRRYKRYARSKREYKRIEAYQNINTSMLVDSTRLGLSVYYFSPEVYYCFIMGTGNQNQPFVLGTDIPLGAGQNQRIGAKINPVKLRIFGTIELQGSPTRDANQNIIFNDLYSSVQCCVRILVLQPKYGNATAYNPWQNGFSNVNPYTSLRGQNNTPKWDPGFFNKLFMKAAQFNQNGQLTIDNIGYVYLTPEENRAHFATMKTPYRRGLGGQFRILKNKLYTIDTSRASIFNFKFKTKKPSQMVWEETLTGENTIATVPRNPIYIVTIPVYPRALVNCSVQMSLNYEFLYTDS